MVGLAKARPNNNNNNLTALLENTKPKCFSTVTDNYYVHTLFMNFILFVINYCHFVMNQCYVSYDLQVCV